MTPPLNSFCLDQPHWRVIASGLSTESWFADGQAVGNGGIFNPSPTDLPSGHFYFRLTRAAAPMQEQIGGGWWIDFEGFHTLSAFARNHGYRLQDAARLMLALPYAWKNGQPARLDRLVKALLKQPLKAYTGYGKPARGAQVGPDQGTRWIPTQHVRVRQYYVPGLCTTPERSMPPKSQLWEQAFEWPAQFTPLT